MAAVSVVLVDFWGTTATKTFSVSNALRLRFGIEDDRHYLRRYEMAIQVKNWSDPRAMGAAFLGAFGLPIDEPSLDFIDHVLARVTRRAHLTQGITALLASLKGVYRLAMLSNTTCFESRLAAEMGLSPFFEREIYSCDTGLLKPDTECYLNACDALGVVPGQCVLIDDQRSNVSAARELGMMCIEFASPEELISVVSTELNVAI